MLNPEPPPEADKVCYIPSQTDSQASTANPRARENPLALAWRDIRTLFSVLYLLPKLCYPFLTKNPTDELSLSSQNIWYLGTLISVTGLESLLCLVVLVAVTLMPGWMSTVIFWGAVWFVWALCVPIQGPMMVESRVGVNEGDEDGDGGNFDVRNGERWIFVNGMMVGNRGLKNNCDRLSQTFGRAITGIHNPTNGLLFDIIECIFQRSFAYNTYSTRYTYDHLKHCLIDPAVHKVVLIAHSQGGIIASMALDLLFTEIPPVNMAKLEVYTFGSAASHFNNPMRVIYPPIFNSPTTPNRRSKGVIRYIEHYVNGEDIVPRWGVMYNVRSAKTRYAGKVFVRNGATGHMFNQHYLENIFPLDRPVPAPPDHANPAAAPKAFLDQVVSVDDCTCRDRDAYYGKATIATTNTNNNNSVAENAVCNGSPVVLVRDDSTSDAGDGGVISVSNGSGFCADDPDNTDDDDDDDDDSNGAGMTVRELSRLWRYLGGADPDVNGRRPLMN
ncbi:hypothetical protein ACJ72_06830 [Emergomyces africanus]|uniref:Uncharacterized protein n=1 Tax=Emergomyces africanus TaxID=1955775 RepID=A0A1B7NQB1_9EURO|nr:hypothetical protein ACJ72_06830 [Emergomyces africanus]